MFPKDSKIKVFMLYFVLLTVSGFFSTSQPRVAAQPKAENVIEGFSGNRAAEGVTGATISGGGRTGLPNEVTRDFGTVAGGEGNLAGERAFVGGGSLNTASGFRAMIGGGSGNVASTINATVGGGIHNLASAYHATVGGGAHNTASELSATVGGGSGNTASNRRSAVSGGGQNTASGVESTVAGGSVNIASAPYTAVGGGTGNTAGGFGSTVSGGAGNQAEGPQATVSGGLGNTAGGDSAVVPGGFGNRADGDFSLAAGYRALVLSEHAGAFLFADSTGFPFTSAAPDELAARVTGGVRFITGVDANGNPQIGVRLPAGSGSWETLSDRAAKTAFQPVNSRAILDRLAVVPINTWTYQGQPAVHHIGPTAQDFQAAFGLGEDGRYISSVDADGVALAAVQGLYQIVQEKDAQIADLEIRLVRLEQGLPARDAPVLSNRDLLLISLGLLLGLGLRSRVARQSRFGSL